MCDENDRILIERERRKNAIVAGLIGFGAGALVGATIALLYAPSSGTETRTKIKEKYSDIKDRAADTVSGVKTRVSSVYQSALGKHGDDKNAAD